MTSKVCSTCRHRHLDYLDEPCNACLKSTFQDGIPNRYWVPITPDQCDIPAPAARKLRALSPGWHMRDGVASATPVFASVSRDSVYVIGCDEISGGELLDIIRAALVVGLVTVEQVRAELEP